MYIEVLTIVEPIVISHWYFYSIFTTASEPVSSSVFNPSGHFSHRVYVLSKMQIWLCYPFALETLCCLTGPCTIFFSWFLQLYLLSLSSSISPDFLCSSQIKYLSCLWISHVLSFLWAFTLNTFSSWKLFPLCLTSGWYLFFRFSLKYDYLGNLCGWFPLTPVIFHTPIMLDNST